MKIKKISAAIALALSATIFAVPALGINIIHVNEILFYSQGENIAEMHFLVHRHSVTSSQPFETKDNGLLPVTVHGCAGCRGDVSEMITRMEILSGRHKSHQVYDDLVNWGFRPGSAVPGEMNFAVEGTFMFRLTQGQTAICENVVLSQTGVGLHNLWYVFSLDGGDKHSGGWSTRLNCHTEDGTPSKFLILKPIDAGSPFEDGDFSNSFSFTVSGPWPGSWNFKK